MAIDQEKLRERKKRTWAKNCHKYKEGALNKRLQRLYGISLSDYRHIELKQKGVCAICKRPCRKHLSVDHDHSTGLIRELLCSRCNYVLGAVGEDQEILISMVAYLKKHKERPTQAASTLVVDEINAFLLAP